MRRGQSGKPRLAQPGQVCLCFVHNLHHPALLNRRTCHTTSPLSFREVSTCLVTNVFQSASRDNTYRVGEMVVTHNCRARAGTI